MTNFVWQLIVHLFYFLLVSFTADGIIKSYLRYWFFFLVKILSDLMNEIPYLMNNIFQPLPNKCILTAERKLLLEIFCINIH